MKTIKLKSIFALILFSILTFGLASIATSAGTNISNNGFEDSLPKTAGGYVVWQGKAGNDWEIFLYNANDGSGPLQITDNDYGDVNPETDGRYVTWASGAAPYGEIFLYDIATSTTIRITDNAQYDHDPTIVDGVLVWVSHSEGVDTMYGPGDIMLYNAADGSYENISQQIDPNNEHDDYAFRFDGNRIQWVQNTSGDMPNYVYDPITDSWGQVLNSYIRNYVYDLTTNKYFRYHIPDDGDLDFDAEYYVEDLTAGGAPYLETKSMAVLVDQQSDGDFLVSAIISETAGRDREILLMDRQNKRGGFLTNNDIKDIQPAIKDNIVVWTGGEDNNSEIYLYKINSDPLAEAGVDQVSECTDAVNKTASVTLDGSASTDPDGDSLTYIWVGPFDIITTDNPLTLVDVPLGFQQEVTLTVDDNNGGLDSDNVNITVQDTTVPDIVISGIEDDSTYALGLVPTAGYLASDSCSGVSSSSGELTGGDSIGLGTFTYSVTAVDDAGNVASAAVSYTVIATPQGTAALIGQFISSGDISDPGKLYDYLSDAQGNIDIDKNHKAINNIDQFKEEIDKLKKKENVSEAAAVVLTGAADAMIAELSGAAMLLKQTRRRKIKD